ncbi:transcriptional regulator ATRX [Thalictrum thalictroides]|uniref:Transcriptional regulator ATRX n=1 Tax=Thalictrum thalictroides TaxID=46969 RepID=A0A7J6UZY2_THATH|nr:transcriptional regulator ATRX [Thalictrum thalictroides]
MEDSTAMTIEFLRARLLAERSVSKSAKERADELSKKVLELEEQLRVVTLQRKKAEKATVEVLAILENSGTDDYTESFDSNSDEERVLNDFKEDSINEESPMTCRSRESKEEEVSGLEREGTRIGRSLSWKSSNSSLNSREKKKDTESRWRQYSFVSTGDPSTKSLVGKSCRKIKPKETRSTEDEVRDDCVLHDAQEKGLASASGSSSDYMNDKPEPLKENSEESGFLISQASLEDRENEISAEVVVSGGNKAVVKGKEEENNTQLINRYEAEEKAQKEWEENFKAKDDWCEHGNQEDITEESKEIEKTAEHSDTNSSAGQVANLEEVASLIQEAIVNTLPNGSPYALCPDMGCLQVQQHNTLIPEDQIDSEFSFLNQEISVATAQREVKQEWSDMACSWSSEHPSNKNLQLQENGSLQHNGESSSENLNELQLAIWQEKPNELETVLEALQRAKLSLKHELNRSSQSSPVFSLVKMTEPLLPAIENADAMKIPSSCSGLFRVPTDLECEAGSQASLLPPNFDPKVSLTKTYTSMGVASNTQFNINPGLGMGVPTDRECEARTGANLLAPHFDSKVLARNEQYNTNLGSGIGSRDSSLKPYFDPWMDTGFTLPASTMFSYPSYAELIPQMPSTNGVRKSSHRLGDLLRDRSSIWGFFNLGERRNQWSYGGITGYHKDVVSNVAPMSKEKVDLNMHISYAEKVNEKLKRTVDLSKLPTPTLRGEIQTIKIPSRSVEKELSSINLHW